ncbi:MAG TPA: hypothetical protein VMD05_05310 [Candidatus Nanoarchaeia archaeon]|nr:hypothetical protein [Candidatus Nanoarchaeia archaeon]
MKKALLTVAVAFLLYNVYQTIISTIFISHFPLIVSHLPSFVTSSQLGLQLTLFLLQESVASVGSYVRLIGAAFAFYCVVLFIRGNPRYIEVFRRVLLFEALYFLLLVPAGLNHVVGSIISSSIFLNVYTGVSFLAQAVLIVPPLLILRGKLKAPRVLSPILWWAGVAAVLYVFGLWIRQGLMWVYAILPSETQQATLIGAVGSVNSVLTLLFAAVLSVVAFLNFRRTKKINVMLVGTAILLVGVYFVIYAVVSVWVSRYLAFLPLIDFWMITLPILGLAILLKSKSSVK